MSIINKAVWAGGLVLTGLFVRHIAWGQDLPFAEGGTTLAVLPDTQYYAQKYPRHFEVQTAWIAENHRKRNIAYVLHLGDIVQSDAPSEWVVAKRSFAMLDGRVPYLLTPGNHDYSDNSRESKLTAYFPVEDFRKWPTFGGLFEANKLDNNFHLFQIGDRPWIAIGLEYGPRKKVMDWANKVLEKYHKRRAIIVTHGYMFYNNQRYDHRKGKQRANPYGYAGEGADGEMLWNHVVRKHPNLMIVVCGHVRTGGLGYRASEGDYGNTVHEMMVNYQRLKGGGQSYMRLLEFKPDGKTVEVQTFSPLNKRVRKSNLESFTFVLQGPTRDNPVRIPSIAPIDLVHAPKHRFDFSGTAEERSMLRGESSIKEGRLILKGDGHFKLPDGLIDSYEEASFEIWVKPTGETYDWNAPVYFGEGGSNDAFYYTFRTLNQHRAEIIRAGHNERIQRSVSVDKNESLHIVVTYDRGDGDDKSRITYFKNGESFGFLETDIVLKELKLGRGRLGPFEGEIEAVRIYDYPLNPGEVAGNFIAGPDRIATSKPKSN